MKNDSIKSHDEAYMEKKKEQRKKTVIHFLIALVMIVIICLLFRFSRARDELAPTPTLDRVYEEDCTTTPKPTEDAAKRLNLAVAGEYHISDEEPLFYIGYLKDNVYDVVFTLNEADDNELYKANFVAPGTNVAIDGTAFLEKGQQKVNCLVGIYTKDRGQLISNCTTVVLNVCYEQPNKSIFIRWRIISMRKKIFATLLTTVIILTILPMNVFTANETFEPEDGDKVTVVASVVVTEDALVALGLDLTISIPTEISLSINGTTFEGSGKIYAYGVMDKEKVLRVNIDETHEN